ncbi:MAG: hypothetical protein QG656_61 [Candidatus Hydrogenedentes bacterium]|nr:hypothetical protein [Candidatus Hydrogenedentota bacterium]
MTAKKTHGAILGLCLGVIVLLGVLTLPSSERGEPVVLGALADPAPTVPVQPATLESPRENSVPAAPAAPEPAPVQVANVTAPAPAVAAAVTPAPAEPAPAPEKTLAAVHTINVGVSGPEKDIVVDKISDEAPFIVNATDSSPDPDTRDP